jgi:putative endonuclease
MIQRLFDHNNSKTGAKYTKARRPVKLVWKKRMKDKNEAAKLERKIKHLTRAEKEKLVNK